jgi:hypothetical protein
LEQKGRETAGTEGAKICVLEQKGRQTAGAEGTNIYQNIDRVNLRTLHKTVFYWELNTF